MRHQEESLLQFPEGHFSALNSFFVVRGVGGQLYWFGPTQLLPAPPETLCINNEPTYPSMFHIKKFIYNVPLYIMRSK